ncbi:aldo/keto reductase [Parafrigoribacterium mesophilum]|uniref:aldo/keto reductase n=1 Tax=Parafrigoribacterium mesophilum TaxID=433646 RepID=UPI0031FC61C2
MPLLGLGTWPMDDEQTAAAVETAIEIGFRLFDTAEQYGNECGVAEGLRRSGIDRDEVFITTKFNRQWHSRRGVRQAFTNAIERLNVDYIDLFTVHWPNPNQGHYVEAVEGLDYLLREGLIRAVGVSNFKPAHLDRLFDVGLVPDVNQLQLDPRHTRNSARALHREYGIATQCWSPLGRDSGLRTERLVLALADKYGRTPSQIILRWHTQQGYSAIPKASSRVHLTENMASFDFDLSTEDLERVSQLDTGEADIYDSDAFGH